MDCKLNKIETRHELGKKKYVWNINGTKMKREWNINYGEFEQ